MPIYIYKAQQKKQSCGYCKDKFEVLQKLNETPLMVCPRCGQKVKKIFAAFSCGQSKSNFDRRAKEKGFHKLKKVDKGKYEKLY